MFLSVADAQALRARASRKIVDRRGGQQRPARRQNRRVLPVGA